VDREKRKTNPLHAFVLLLLALELLARGDDGLELWEGVSLVSICQMGGRRGKVPAWSFWYSSVKT
jgi:hypothetical protein